jgi:hypothetical protein
MYAFLTVDLNQVRHMMRCFQEAQCIFNPYLDPQNMTIQQFTQGLVAIYGEDTRIEDLIQSAAKTLLAEQIEVRKRGNC